VFQHHCPVDDHVADDAVALLGELAGAIAEPVVRENARAHLPRERQDEEIRIRARRRLMHDAVVDQLLVCGLVVDLMPQRRVGDDERLEAVIGQLAHHELDVVESGLAPLGRVSDVGAVDEHR
jgi:hypothetical protein